MTTTITVRKPTSEEVAQVEKWPVWTKEPSTFDWSYDEQETCLIMEGKATIAFEGGEVTIGTNDWVVFPKGLSCTWKIEKTIRKHYKFG